ncbi:Origin recognition complex subunit 2 [Tilletia horrida]|nr:Origin recognition complex subunit 2 [Tilletia horrida]
MCSSQASRWALRSPPTYPPTSSNSSGSSSSRPVGKTYADYFSSSTAASEQRRGPVRITISRGARYAIDSKTGLPVFEEVWEEEEIADTVTDMAEAVDLNPSVELDLPTRRYGKPRSHWPQEEKLHLKNERHTAKRVPAQDHLEPSIPAPGRVELDASAEDAHNMVSSSSFLQVQESTTSLYIRETGPSIMVLDTNTLIECSTFFQALFPLLLVRNLNALLLQHVLTKVSPPPAQEVPLDFRPAPFRLALPHIVVRELDKIKGSYRDINKAARQANRWILACLQAQKRSVSTFLSDQAYQAVLEAAVSWGASPEEVVSLANELMSSVIPPEAWALHFETSKQFSDRTQDTDSLLTKTNDEVIVDLCVSMAASTGLPIWLLSNDTNARTLAEIEGIRGLDLENVLRGSTASRPQSKSGGVPPAGDAVRWTRSTGAYSDPLTAAKELIEQWDAQVGNGPPPAPGVRTHKVAAADPDGAEAMDMDP